MPFNVNFFSDIAIKIQIYLCYRHVDILVQSKIEYYEFITCVVDISQSKKDIPFFDDMIAL